MNSFTAFVAPVSAMERELPMPADRLNDAMAMHATSRSWLSAPLDRQRGMRSRTAAQSGVGLIEVLIAVLILSIGFLGIAALEAMSLSTNNSAMARSMATIASYSILDAMRADKDQATKNAYDGTVTANACPTTSATLAQNQLGQWCKQLGDTLGATAHTTGNIACLTTAECTVTITFNDSRAGVGGANNQTIVTKGIL